MAASEPSLASRPVGASNFGAVPYPTCAMGCHASDSRSTPLVRWNSRAVQSEHHASAPAPPNCSCLRVVPAVLQFARRSLPCRRPTMTPCRHTESCNPPRRGLAASRGRLLCQRTQTVLLPCVANSVFVDSKIFFCGSSEFGDLFAEIAHWRVARPHTAQGTCITLLTRRPVHVHGLPRLTLCHLLPFASRVAPGKRRRVHRIDHRRRRARRRPLRAR